MLNEGFANTVEKNIYIRIEIWRTLNDSIRYDESLKGEVNDSLFKKNLKKLIEIFEPINEEQILLVAEMYRELGAFKKASYLLESIKEIKQTSTFIQIENAIKSKQSKVFKI